MNEQPSSKPTSKILPQFAAQIEGYRWTLEERFFAVLERVSADLESGTVYHAPDRAATLLSNFIGTMKGSDCIAACNTVQFGQALNELNVELSKIKFLEQPRQRASA